MRRTLEKYEQPPPEGPSPDAGLAAIGAAFTAQLGGGGGAPAGADRERESRPRDRVRPTDVWPLDLPPQSSTAATNFDPVDWGPPTGRAWRIRAVTLTLSGASLVQVYREAIVPVQLRFQTTGSGVWEPSAHYLLPGKRLIVVFTGGGGTVAIDGEQISLSFLPVYMA